VSIGTVIESSEIFIARIYMISVTTYRVEPENSASQNRVPSVGTPVNNRAGSRNGSAKQGNAHASTYSLLLLSLKHFLLKTSFKDSKNAVRSAKMSQSISPSSSSSPLPSLPIATAIALSRYQHQ